MRCHLKAAIMKRLRSLVSTISNFRISRTSMLTKEVFKIPFLGKGKVGKVSDSELWSERIKTLLEINRDRVKKMEFKTSIFNHS